MKLNKSRYSEKNLSALIMWRNFIFEASASTPRTTSLLFDCFEFSIQKFNLLLLFIDCLVELLDEELVELLDEELVVLLDEEVLDMELLDVELLDEELVELLDEELVELLDEELDE